jgi:CO dehydrogenase maturation factor
MPITIALAGKGGVGKTTSAGMIVKYLIQNQKGSIIAIDADPSSNLHLVLGMDLEWTVGDIREDMLLQVKESITAGGAAMGALPGGMNKRDYLNYEIHSAVSESKRVDLIAMGKPEGPGCYCAVNHNLREVIDDIGKSYDYVLIDNEAGMEHLSRRTTRKVDFLFIVSDPTQRGLNTARTIGEMVNSLDVEIDKTFLILNRTLGEIPEPVKETISKIGIDYLGHLPSNDELMSFDYEGKPLVELGDESPVYQAIEKLMDKAGIIPNK